MNDEIDSEYLSYNGFNRPALVAGVPLMIMLPLFAFAIFGGFIGISLFGLIGVLHIGFSVMMIIVIRAMTESDPNALKVIAFNLKGFFLKMGSPIFAVRGKK